MTTIRCPICRDPIEGQGDLGLSRALREHFVSIHEMSMLGERPALGGEMKEADRMTLRAAEGPVRRDWQEDQQQWTSPPDRGPEERKGYLEHRRERESMRDDAPDHVPEGPGISALTDVKEWITGESRERTTLAEDKRSTEVPGGVALPKERARRGYSEGFEGAREDERSETTVAPVAASSTAVPPQAAPPKYPSGVREDVRAAEMHRGDEEMMHCPLCGARVEGVDGEMLSDRMADHMVHHHDIRPLVGPRVQR